MRTDPHLCVASVSATICRCKNSGGSCRCGCGMSVLFKTRRTSGSYDRT
ncbi:hypothetical protein GGE61_006419 [Rhizobium leguminosarum]|nr:hypothetical protein [Rhizobium leguminosarum]